MTQADRQTGRQADRQTDRENVYKLRRMDPSPAVDYTNVLAKAHTGGEGERGREREGDSYSRNGRNEIGRAHV